MFETQIHAEIYAVQVKIDEIRKRYGPYLSDELKIVLLQAHVKIDTAVDVAEAALRRSNEED